MCLDKLKAHSKRPSLVLKNGEESRKEDKRMEGKDILLNFISINTMVKYSSTWFYLTPTRENSKT